MNKQFDDALKVLGIPADSDREMVSSAFRRLARATHPDVSSDPDAAERFAAVSAAYRLLSRAPGPSSRAAVRSPDDSMPTRVFVHSQEPPPNLFHVDDYGDDQSTTVWDPAVLRLHFGVPSRGVVRSSPRPPIVAGPVVVRSAQPEGRGSSGRG